MTCREAFEEHTLVPEGCWDPAWGQYGDHDVQLRWEHWQQVWTACARSLIIETPLTPESA